MITTVVSAGQSLRTAPRADRSFATLDAVTLDANGTLVRLRDPVPALAELLRAHGVVCPADRVAAAFAAEGDYYIPRSLEGRDEATLAAFRRRCVEVFLGAAGADLDPEELVPSYIAALRFEVVPGVPETMRALRARGLALAVVSNWDISVHERLEELELAPLVDTVVASADVGVAKPDPRIFEIALGRLGVAAERALHVGDGSADEDGAASAGLRFAPTPLVTAFTGWT
jgi:HAD superfamily hydrolase (TIGR01509 family)